MLLFKRTVSRILAKFRHRTLKPVKEHFNDTANTMGGTNAQKLKKGRYGFLKNCWAEQFSKLESFACNLKDLDCMLIPVG